MVAGLVRRVLAGVGGLAAGVGLLAASGPAATADTAGAARGVDVGEPVAATTACGVVDVVLSPDLNGDGGADVISQRANGDLYAYPLAASGRFGSPWKLGNGFTGLKLYAPGDWNGDGFNDLIAVALDGRMFLYTGTGSGALKSGGEIGHGWSGFEIIPVGDITSDGAVDMLGITPGGLLHLYAGTGKGGFKWPYPQVGHGWNLGYQLYAAGDVNGDGKGDILAIRTDGKLFFYQGRGNGTFLKAVEKGHGWDATIELRAGTDVNGDGLADILGWRTDGTLHRYLSKGGGTFAAATQIGNGWTGTASCPVVSTPTPAGDPRCTALGYPSNYIYYTGSHASIYGTCTPLVVVSEIEAAIAPYHHPNATGCSINIAMAGYTFDGAAGSAVGVAQSWAAKAATWTSGKVLKIEVIKVDDAFTTLKGYSCWYP